MVVFTRLLDGMQRLGGHSTFDLDSGPVLLETLHLFMSEEAKPDGGKDAYTRDRMNRIAHLIDEELPAGWGFGLLVFPLGGAPGRCNYVANGHRKGVIEEMKAFIKRSEEAQGDDDFYKHHNK